MLNLEEEAKFAELRKKCSELKIVTAPDVFIGLSVHDSNGILVFDDIQRGHSWTRNFYNFAFCAMADCVTVGSTFGAGYMNSKNNSGSVASNQSYSLSKTNTVSGNGYHGPVANQNIGIAVGTGNTAFSTEDYNLATIISSGNAAGQLYYQAQAVAVATYDNTAGAEKWTNVHYRILNNNSGSAITIKETGLYWYGGIYAGLAGYSYLLERSVLGTEVSVPNGAQLTVTYSIVMDISAID